MEREPIAVVGRGCVLPGALDPDTFWDNIAAGKCSLSPVPDGRWRLPGGRQGREDEESAGWAEVGGYVQGFDQAFDPAGFAADAGQIMRLDPLYRWVLHAARQALREAGQQAAPPVSAARTGLVLGNLSYPSAGLTRFAEQIWRDGQPDRGTDPMDRFSSGLPAYFAARALGLGAGSFALDAACASSLYAVKLGCDRLHDGTADLMLAGAVTCPDDLLIHSGFRALSAMSRTGRSRPFHRGADGLVPGEGAVLVALMRLPEAISAGARILGVIRAIGLSNDGQRGGLLAPDEDGQTRAMRLAYEAAGVPPETVSLLECHATGTWVGDSVEARGAARIFSQSNDLPVGSVKSNVGHLLAAAGGTGLLKVLGAMRAGVRPATLGADDPIEEFDGTPLRVLTEPEDWPGARRAAISAFGFGGANAHLVIDAWEAGPVHAAGRRPASAADRRNPLGPVAITAIGARVGDGADAEDFREAVLLGQQRPGPRASIEVQLTGLRFPPVDLESAHAQHVLVLEAAREAARGRRLPRERTMVIVGMGVDPEVARYAVLRRARGVPDSGTAVPPLTASGVLGTMPNLVANRINMQLDLAGPGYTVSAEEASGLVALELASRALRAGEADAALVGAVDLSCERVHQAALRELGRDRRPGDAAVVLVLKRLADARRDGDPVIAVLDDAPAIPPQHGLVVGDGGVAGQFDPAGLFGTAHAAHGLVSLAAAATAARHRVLPRTDGPAVVVPGDLTAVATVRPLGGPPMSVALRGDGPAQPWAAGPPPSLHVYSGADRQEVVRALAAGDESTAGPARLAIVSSGGEPPAAQLDAARQWLTSGGPRPGGMAYRDAPLRGEVAFVFTNGSATYPGMGTELALAFPAIGAVADQDRSGTPGVLDQIWSAARLAAAHVKVSRGVLGIAPAAAIGYSSGESAALAALGAWTDTSALHADLRASDLFTTGLTGEFSAVRRAWRRLGIAGRRWASFLVSATPDRIAAVLADEAAVHLMAICTPNACVVGGEATACEAALERLGAKRFALGYEIAAHAPELAEVREEYRRLHLRPTQDVPGVRFYSGATGDSYRATAERAADAILAQALGTVDFVRVIERAWADGVRVFIEHGPQGQCTGWIRRVLRGRDHLAVALDAPGGRGLRQMCLAVAELAAAGVPADTAAFFGHLGKAAGRKEPADLSPAVAAVLRLPAHPPALRLPQPEPVAQEPPPAVARLVASQWQQVSSLHQDFLTRQAQAHARFLRMSGQAIADLTQAMATGGTRTGGTQPSALAQRPLPGPRFGRAALERLAVGKISELFGPMFAVQDDRRRQTRMPAPPLLLADRVTGIEGAAGSMGTGTIWTETDVGLDAWYLDHTGRMPAGIMIEAGQADLLLISWLGVDLRTGGERVYRLLGCELTYHGSPVEAGSTVRYEISIDRHAEHDDIRLFFFHYDCYVGDNLVMTVRNGQAGFFTDDELADTTGVHWDPGQEDPGAGQVVAPRRSPPARRFGPDAVRAFAAGRPVDCFGPGWRATRAHVRTPRISDGRLLLIDEVTDVDPAGGPWQRGYLRAETEVRADDWFFAGHFKNDPCMPGTLMFEGGLQAMAFYLAALGFTVDNDGGRFEPVAERECQLRCRGQVSPASRKIVYEVFVQELTTDPFPTLYADVLGTVDGVKAFHARLAGLRLVPDWPLDYWRKLGPSAVQPGVPMPLPALGGLLGADRPVDHDRAAQAGGVRQDYAALLSYAWGRFGSAIGPALARFDGGRRAPRLPGPPYHFMTRVIAIDGPLGGMRVGSAVTAEYDVPDRAWYFEQNEAGVMPFAVLMEIALQPCGWLAMYAGSVLESETDLRFRNLDGTGTVLSEVGPDTPAVRTRAELLDISRSDDMIIETFAVECTMVGGPADGTRIFTLRTAFGFFPVDMLEHQVGLPSSAAERSRLAQPCDRSAGLRVPGREPRLAGPMLLMLDRITGYWPDGGAAGLGRLRAEKDVDPDEWFFKAHFFQDPVQPGSLGVEAMCQLLQWYLIERGLAADLPRPRFEPVLTEHQLTWKYRGQVVPANERITVEMEVAELGEDERGRYAIATAWLWVDGLRIYQVRDLGMRVQGGG